AESYTYNKDFTEVTFKLRKGVEWSDGQPFTADDMVFTINMLKNNAPALGGWSVEMQAWVKDATAADAQTAKITLTNPYPRFVFNDFAVRIYNTIYPVPKHIWEGK